MKLKEWFDSPDKWCQGAYAKDKDGKSVNFESDEICSMYLYGAIQKFYESGFERNRIYTLLGKNIFETILNYNDNPYTRFEDIKKLVNELNI